MGWAVLCANSDSFVYGSKNKMCLFHILQLTYFCQSTKLGILG